MILSMLVLLNFPSIPVVLLRLFTRVNESVQLKWRCMLDGNVTKLPRSSVTYLSGPLPPATMEPHIRLGNDANVVILRRRCKIPAP